MPVSVCTLGSFSVQEVGTTFTLLDMVVLNLIINWEKVEERELFSHLRKNKSGINL